MRFDTCRWPVSVDDSGEALYGNLVNNRVQITPLYDDPYHVFIQVPADLFKFLKEVDHVPRGVVVRLWLREVSDGWNFGYTLPEGPAPVLWGYTKLPAWAMLKPRRNAG